jgi:hypothetical protein
MSTRLLPVLAAITALAYAADLSGRWHLLPAESDFGKVNPPQSQTVDVSQSGDRLDISSTLTDHRGPLTSKYSLDASGKQVQNEIRGAKSVSTASWRGGCLHVRTSTSLQDVEIKSTDQWCLSAENRKLTIYRSASTPQGDLEQKFVYRKNP